MLDTPFLETKTCSQHKTCVLLFSTFVPTISTWCKRIWCLRKNF